MQNAILANPIVFGNQNRKSENGACFHFCLSGKSISNLLASVLQPGGSYKAENDCYLVMFDLAEITIFF